MDPEYARGTTTGEVASMELNRNQHQGLFGESYIQVLASAAGLTVARKNLDVDGVDFTIGYVGDLGSMRHPEIQVQVKTWAHRSAVWRDGGWKYRLRAKHFNELAGRRFMLPRFLVLVVVPDEWTDYAVVREGVTELSHCAYWRSVLDHDPVNLDPAAMIPVDVPGANLLTVEALLALMKPDTPARREG
jgi:hypothetical protein